MDINRNYGIFLTESAKMDLKNIYNYISDNLKEPIIAHKLMRKIEKSIYSLERLPYRYAETTIKPHNKKLRRIIINKYIVLYKINEANSQVIIYNVLYGAKDYLKYF